MSKKQGSGKGRRGFISRLLQTVKNMGGQDKGKHAPVRAVEPQTNKSQQEPQKRKSKEAQPERVQKKKKPSKPWVRPDIPKVEGKSRFFDFDLDDRILQGVCEIGFEYATPIQAKTLEHTLKGRDSVGRARTGTGKTAAFLISSMNKVLGEPKNLKTGQVRTLILAPTRELANQIYKDALNIGKFTSLNIMVVFGGMSIKSQKEKLSKRSVDILVATPGRLLDLMGDRAIDLRTVETLIIDEADRMLDMGFIPDVKRIVRRCPEEGQRQTMMWSATFTESIHRLIRTWQHDPIKVEEEEMVTDLVEQHFYMVSRDERYNCLFYMLEHETIHRMIIFANRKDLCEEIHYFVNCRGIRAGLLTGDIPQKKRMRMLEDFREGVCTILVATDVAARGIHVDNVSHVVNFDLPYEVEDHVHRIGRTGRAGAKGLAVSFVDEFGGYIIEDLEKFTGEKIVCEQAPDAMLDFPVPPVNTDFKKETYSRQVNQKRRQDGGRRSGGGKRHHGNRRHSPRR